MVDLVKDEDGIEILDVDWEEPARPERKREDTGPRRHGPSYNVPGGHTRGYEPPPQTPSGQVPPGYQDQVHRHGPPYQPGPYPPPQYPGYPQGSRPGYPVYSSYPQQVYYHQPPPQYPPRQLSDPMSRLNPLMILLVFGFITIVTIIILLPILTVLLYSEPTDVISVLSNPLVVLILLVVQDIVFVVVPWWIYFRSKLLTWAEMGLNFDRFAERIGMGLVIGFGFSAMIIGLVVGIDNSTSGGIPHSPQMSVADYVFTMLGGVIVAPIAEEFFFRGVVFKGSLKWMEYKKIGSAFIVSLLFSSFLFAVVHGYDIFGTIVVFIAGAVFALLFHKTGSLVPSMFAHGAYNAGVITAAFLGLM